MKYILSRFNHDISWLLEYTKDYVLYDRSPEPLEGSIVVPNLGSDISDKFKFIIDNYDSLPEIAVYTKANLFKYITKDEFDEIRNTKTFTPILTRHHKVGRPMCFYSEDGLYNELNEDAFIHVSNMPRKFFTGYNDLARFLNIPQDQYVKFAPGSNYILPKENILKHSKELYIQLKSFLDWTVYPAEAMMMERALYYLWR